MVLEVPMGHKVSNPHGDDKSSPIGRHVDVYKVDSSGKRSEPHHKDLKVSYPADKPFVRDVDPPGARPETIDLTKK